MRNAWMFHLLVIVAAFVFCARPVHADPLVTACVMQVDGGAWAGCVGGQPSTGVSPAAVIAGQVTAWNSLPNKYNAAFSAPVLSGEYYVSSGAVDYYSNVDYYQVSYQLTVSGTCTAPQVLQPDGSCSAPTCAAPGEYAGQAVTSAGYGNRPICAPDLCYYNVSTSITTGEGAEPPNPQTMSWLNDVTGVSCTVVDGAGAGGCPAGQADLGFGCMTATQNEAIYDALANPVQFVDPCIAAGTCTPQADPCIAAGTCSGTGTGPGGTAGTTGGTGTAGATYVDPCIIAGTCTAAADPCIAAGTCSGTGTGAGGTAGSVNPCIAAGTCAGSGAGTGAGTGGATESTQREILKEIKGNALFSSLGTVPTDAKIITEGIAVNFTPTDFFNSPACPAPITYSLLGVNREIAYTPACDFLDQMRPLILAFATITVAVIYIRGFTPT